MADFSQLIFEVKNKKAIQDIKQVNNELSKTEQTAQSLFSALASGWSASKLLQSVGYFADKFKNVKMQAATFGRIFGNSLNTANKGISNLINNFNETQRSAQRLVNVIGSRIAGLNLPTDKLGQWSSQLARVAEQLVAAGVAPNIEEVAKKLSQGLLGQVGGLKDIGVVIDTTSVAWQQQIKDLQDVNGLTKQIAQATLVYNKILQDTQKHAGAFGNLSNDLAQALGDIKNTLQSGLFAKIGNMLSIILTPLAQAFNNLMSNGFTQWLGSIVGTLGLIVIPLKLIQKVITFFIEKFLTPRASSFATTARELGGLSQVLFNLEKIRRPGQAQAMSDDIIKNYTYQKKLMMFEKRVQTHVEKLRTLGYDIGVVHGELTRTFSRSMLSLHQGLRAYSSNIKRQQNELKKAVGSFGNIAKFELNDQIDKLDKIKRIASNLNEAKIRRQTYFNTLGPQILLSISESISMALASSNSIILNTLAPYIHTSLHYISQKVGLILVKHPGLNKIFVDFSLWMASQVRGINRYWASLNNVAKAGTVNRIIVGAWDLLPNKVSNIIGKTFKILGGVLLKTIGTAFKLFFIGLGKAIMIGLKGLLLIGKAIFSAVGIIVTGIIAIVTLAIDQIFNDGRITQAVGEFIYHAWDWIVSIFTGEQTMRQMEARLKKQEQQRRERIKKAREQSTKALSELDQLLYQINIDKILQPITNAQQYTIVFNKLKNTQKQIKNLNKQWRDNIDQIYSLQLEDTKIPILKQRIMDIDSERKKLKQLQIKLSENVIKYEEELLQKKQKQSDYYKKLYQLRLKQIQDTISFEQTITRYGKQAFKLFGQDSSTFEIDKLKQKMQLISKQIYSGFDLTTEQKVNLRKALMDASIQMGNIRINAIQKQANAIKKYSNAISNFVIQMWKKMTGFINRGVKAITVGSQEGIAFAASSAQKFSLKNISNKSLEQTRQNKINEIKNIQQQTGNNIIKILDELKNIRPEIKNNRIKAVRAL